MIKKVIDFSIVIYNSADELLEADKKLLIEAQSITSQAYAPYSQFKVGAAARLDNGKIVTATNQENASYPVGICAERVLLSVVASQYNNAIIETIAVSYNNLKGESMRPISPCGICRQSLTEYEDRTGNAIRLLLSGLKGEVFVIEKAHYLLPLGFNSGHMK